MQYRREWASLKEKEGNPGHSEITGPWLLPTGSCAEYCRLLSLHIL